MGSFDTAMIESRLFLCEKYKKATEGDLATFQRELGAQVFRNLSGATANVTWRGRSIDLRIVDHL